MIMVVKHKVEVKELDNGLKLMLIDVKGAVTFKLEIINRGGYRIAKSDQFELPHLLEHLAFDGNKKYPDKEKYMFEIEKRGVYQNATTATNLIKYYYDGVCSETEDIIDLALAQYCHPLFRQDDINNEMEVIDNELSRYLEDDIYRAGYLNLQLSSPFKWPDLKTRVSQMREISREDILEYYYKTHTSANTMIILAGDLSVIDLESKLSQISKTFEDAGLTGRSLLSLGQTYSTNQDQAIVNHLKSVRQQQANFELDYLLRDYNLDDRYPMNFFNIIYNGGFASRLFEKARSAGLSYGPSSGYTQTLDYASFNLSDETIAGKLPDLYKLMLSELDRLLNGEINKYEFARAKGFILGSLQRSFQLPEDLARFYREDFVYGRELRSPDQVIDIYRDFDMDSILATAKCYIQPANSILTVVDSQQEIDSVFSKR